LIRHRELPRLENSTLKYHDQGFVPVSDLGGSKKEGWINKTELQERPVISVSGRIEGKAEPATAPSALAPQNKPVEKANLFSRLFGSPAHSHIKSATGSGIADGYLEVVFQEKNSLRINGWILLRDGAPDLIEIVGLNGDSVTATTCHRADIAQSFPHLKSAINSGFKVTLPDDLFWQKDRYQFSIVAKRAGRVAFRCRVGCHHLSAGEHPEAPFCIRNGILDI
jgi:hypothetical protein